MPRHLNCDTPGLTWHRLDPASDRNHSSWWALTRKDRFLPQRRKGRKGRKGRKEKR